MVSEPDLGQLLEKTVQFPHVCTFLNHYIYLSVCKHIQGLCLEQVRESISVSLEYWGEDVKEWESLITLLLSGSLHT